VFPVQRLDRIEFASLRARVHFMFRKYLIIFSGSGAESSKATP
jgi:hypothetical protein